jgi:hypothetical protein
MTSERLEESSSAPLGLGDDSLVQVEEPPEVIE